MESANCVFCETQTAAAFTVIYAGKEFTCCVSCAALLFSGHPCDVLSQCCECGVIIRGPFAGKHIAPVGDLTVGVSHGICIKCKDAKLANWRASRKTLHNQEKCIHVYQ